MDYTANTNDLFKGNKSWMYPAQGSYCSSTMHVNLYIVHPLVHFVHILWPLSPFIYSLHQQFSVNTVNIFSGKQFLLYCIASNCWANANIYEQMLYTCKCGFQKRSLQKVKTPQQCWTKMVKAEMIPQSSRAYIYSPNITCCKLQQQKHSQLRVINLSGQWSEGELLHSL